MDSLPIVTRELRLASRRARTYWIRGGLTLAASIYVLGLLSPSFRGVTSPAVTGRTLFQLIGGATFFLCLIAGAFVTADALSEEKREGTMGLLFLTNLRGYDVVFSKLVAKSLNSFYALIAILPLMSLPILFGGVTPGEFIRLAFVLVNTLFFSTAIGLAISSISTQGRRACLGTLAFVGAMSGLPWLVDYVAGSPAAGHFLTTFSPAYPWYLIDEKRYLADPAGFSASFWLAHLVGWIAVVAACFATPRTWKDFAPNPRQALWQRRWRDWTLGTEADQRVLRLRWLNINPVLWLARRERHRRAFFWGFLALYFALWFLSYLFLPKAWATSEGILVTGTLLHLVLKLWLALEASRRLASDKRNGVLELLLVTPIEVSDILRGLVIGLKRQFLLPFFVVTGIDVLLLLFGLSHSAKSATLPLFFLAGMGLFAADAFCLTWVGLWEGLSAKDGSQAFIRTLLQVLVFPSLLFVGLGGVIFVSGSGSLEPLIACWFVVGYLTDLALCLITTSRLTEQFRSAATGVSESRPRRFWPIYRPKKTGELEPLSANFSLFSDP